MSYDALGVVYDQDSHLEVTGGFYRTIKPLLRSLTGRRVLDLGCGSGLLTVRLASRGCRVLGIDSSRQMLKVARARCRIFGSQVRFSLADLRSFDSRASAAGAFACGDVINHFQSEHRLASFFKNVSRHLERGGIFVFDALNRWCFENYWADHTYHFEGEHGDIVMECSWDSSRGIGTAAMTVYEENSRGLYKRRFFTLRERLFETPKIDELLKRAGFSKVLFVDWSPWTDQHEEKSNDRTLWTVVR